MGACTNSQVQVHGQPESEGLFPRYGNHVYELYRPKEGLVQLEILFFHGFELDRTFDVHISTWTNEKAVLWPATWLPEEFPQARIFSILYDASIRRTLREGTLDLYFQTDSIAKDIVAAEIGQTPGCPVILVGYCFGGLVTKALCIHAHRSELRNDGEQMENFLRNLSGLFFLATPHRGLEVHKDLSSFSRDPLPVCMNPFNDELARLHEEFLSACKNLWPQNIMSLGELRGTPKNLFEVPEASARCGGNFHTVRADHVTICKPTTKGSPTFKVLVEFIRRSQPVNMASAVLPSKKRDPPPELRSSVSEVEPEQVKQQFDGGHCEVESFHPESNTFVIKGDHNAGDERVDVAKVGLNPGPKLPIPLMSSSLELVRPKSPWKKLDKLGSGAFGIVYRAIDNNGKFFAVKEVSVVEQDKEAVDQLKQEIDLLSRFSHENIVRYLGTERADEKLYIFLELVSQGSLATVCRICKLSESQISMYTREILKGLKYLHDRKIVHRDIKCANILVGTDDCKLADFGMAKQISSLDANKSCKGTAFWMAPEVIDPRKTYGPPADIWSLGCSILEMATQSHPFKEMEPIQVFWFVGNGNAPQIPEKLSAVAKDFVKRCLVVNATNRSTAAELLQHEFVQHMPDD